MGQLLTIWSYIRKYKYVAASLVFLLIIGVLDENSLWVRYGRKAEIANLRHEIEKYEAQYAAETAKLEALRNDPSAVERMAREVYLMKRPNEDVYVFRNVDPEQIQSRKHVVQVAAAPAPAASDSAQVAEPADSLVAPAPEAGTAAQ